MPDFLSFNATNSRTYLIMPSFHFPPGFFDVRFWLFWLLNNGPAFFSSGKRYYHPSTMNPQHLPPCRMKQTHNASISTALSFPFSHADNLHSSHILFTLHNQRFSFSPCFPLFQWSNHWKGFNVVQSRVFLCVGEDFFCRVLSSP